MSVDGAAWQSAEGQLASWLPILASRPRRAGPGAAERGAASVLVVAVVGAVFAATVLALVLGSVAVAGQRARSAADLAALAGATRARDGADRTESCAVAAHVARANRATLESCAQSGAVIGVVVAVDVPLWPTSARATARAGPQPGLPQPGLPQPGLPIGPVVGARRG